MVYLRKRIGDMVKILTFDLNISTFQSKNVDFKSRNVYFKSRNFDTLYIRTRKEQKPCRVDPGKQEKTWCVKCNKTIKALHFVQYDSALVNIAFQFPITHHIALNEVQ